ncbi:efflux RND transporter periplasmic adaptor subunit [Telluria beijingensis]|uniref:efflux RND transporter periplasmic adaptor subunit n=1 Tax=Telluria beijingensis TaxID=3068633 RepID=UPI0027953AE3|nr:efflux RND transporter periplasmic adaptor subunit [Massilia sp. REN29]
MSPLPSRLSHFSRRTLIVGAGASFAIFAGLLAFVTRPAQESRQPASRPALTVTLEPPQRLRWEHSIEAHGAIEPWQELVIGARTSGLPLAEVSVEVGDTVRRGALLARFDAALPRAEAAQLEAALVQAQANARQAGAVRERMRKLAASGAVSRQDVQQAETEADTTAAQVALARAQLRAKRLLLAYADVRAADDGVVSARSATPGAVANAGDELFRIIRRHRLEWRAELTPLQLRQMRAGQHIELALPDGGLAPAVVRQAAPRLDPQTRLATVYADVNPRSAARAGMYASGRIALGSSEAMTVGAHSVVLRDGRSWIFVADADAGVARALQVTVGRRQGERSEIVSPLPPGVGVVGQGAAFLKDGDRIHVAPAAASGGPRA